MKTYLLPIRAEEVVLHDGTIMYQMRDSDTVMYTINGKYVNLDEILITVIVDTENKLQEVFETTVIAIRRGQSQLENKFIIDLFGKIGCKFDPMVNEHIKNGSDVAPYIYGEIETGGLYHTGSLKNIGKYAENHETVNVLEVDLLNLMDMVQRKEFEENKV
jgi:hypothetical protein